MPSSTPYTLLTYKQTVELIRQLNNGTAGFDYAKYKLADLRHILNTWIQQGYFSADHVQSLADSIAAVLPAAMPVPMPFGAVISVPPPPAALQPVPVPAPAMPAPAMPAPAMPAPVPQPIIAPAPVPQPIPVPAPAAPTLPSVPLTYPRTVPAAAVFPEFADVLPPNLTCTLHGHPDAPAIDPDYVFQAGHVLQALAAIAVAPTLRMWLGGPRGTGKTEFVRQIAARLGRPMFRVNFNRSTEPSEVIGDQGLRDGNTLWVDGPVAAACRVDCAVLLFDEISYGAAGNTSALNPILERAGAHVRLPRTAEVLAIPPGMVIFAADNTMGFGDATGEYAARNILGLDTRDRFSLALEFDYLPQAQESALLRSIVARSTGRKMLKPVADAIVRVMRVAREKAHAGELLGAPSLRGASTFAMLLAYGVPVIDAYTSTIIRNAPPESAEELRQIFAANWPAELTSADVANPPQFFAA
jgi:MoxR-like ATPase